jgi:hypothetical protein
MPYRSSSAIDSHAQALRSTIRGSEPGLMLPYTGAGATSIMRTGGGFSPPLAIGRQGERRLWISPAS